MSTVRESLVGYGCGTSGKIDLTASLSLKRNYVDIKRRHLSSNYHLIQTQMRKELTLTNFSFLKNRTPFTCLSLETIYLENII